MDSICWKLRLCALCSLVNIVYLFAIYLLPILLFACLFFFVVGWGGALWNWTRDISLLHRERNFHFFFVNLLRRQSVCDTLSSCSAIISYIRYNDARFHEDNAPRVEQSRKNISQSSRSSYYRISNKQLRPVFCAGESNSFVRT